MSLKSLYEHRLFHGILTISEAEALWKASVEESGNREAYIWFLTEIDDHFESVIYGSRNRDSKPASRFVEQLNYSPMAQKMVQRRNPHELGQVARATIFDNLNKSITIGRTINHNCCDRIWKLMMKIDQLPLPVSEKLMMKKLIPAARRLLSSVFAERLLK